VGVAAARPEDDAAPRCVALLGGLLRRLATRVREIGTSLGVVGEVDVFATETRGLAMLATSTPSSPLRLPGPARATAASADLAASSHGVGNGEWDGRTGGVWGDATTRALASVAQMVLDGLLSAPAYAVDLPAIRWIAAWTAHRTRGAPVPSASSPSFVSSHPSAHFAAQWGPPRVRATGDRLPPPPHLAVLAAGCLVGEHALVRSVARRALVAILTASSPGVPARLREAGLRALREVVGAAPSLLRRGAVVRAVEAAVQTDSKRMKQEAVALLGAHLGTADEASASDDAPASDEKAE
jgi:hypothetical protein